METIKINPVSDDTRWVALDSENNIISEGQTPVEASDKAKEIMNNFFLCWVGKKNVSYIF